MSVRIVCKSYVLFSFEVDIEIENAIKLNAHSLGTRHTKIASSIARQKQRSSLSFQTQPLNHLHHCDYPYIANPQEENPQVISELSLLWLS